MNFTTISHIPSRNLKAPYVTTIAGLALAVSALVAFGPSRSTSQPVAPVRQVSVAAAAGGEAIPHHTFILAANVAQQADMEAANSDLRSFNPERNDITVLLAGSPAAQSFLDEGARELMAAGVPFTITDMTSVTSVVQPQPQVPASDADIAASVLSTELANYLAPAEGPKASDADVMASVISTEQATYGVQSVQRRASEADIMASVISTEKAAGY